MPDELSVRQWQERYRARAFDSKDTAVQRAAGWWDWYCRYDALAGRLKKIAPVITGIKEPLILDHYSVWFENVRSPGRKAVYDRVQFEPLGDVRDGRIFRVDFGSPDEPEKWTLYTERFGFSAPEYGCAHVREMVEYISTMAHELEQGIRPPFLDEKAAVVEYILTRNVLYPSRALRREGEHSYSFLDRDDGRWKTVHVARSLKDAPPDFEASRTREINGLYVYCPEDAEQPQPAPQQAAKKSHKKKEAERDEQRTPRTGSRPTQQAGAAAGGGAGDHDGAVRQYADQLRRDRRYFEKARRVWERGRPPGQLPEAAGPAAHVQHSG